ncbi:MAG TPA: SH3 domain-containing protein [Thermomicrobiales bacterium]|nr:SH3 domain-containing protein [Thermomicrobiales bacterium]
MTTARSMTMLRRARTLALAGTLAIGAMIPVVPATLASYDDQTPTVVTTPDQFDIAPDGGLVGLSAVVQTGTGGADLLADPAHDGEVLQRLDDGTVVNLRVDVADTVYDDDGATRWWPVEVGGQEGWVSGFFLVDPSLVEEEEQPSAPPTNRVPYDYTGSMQAEVSADGDGLVLRAEPDASSEAVTSIPEGSIVDLRIDMLDTVYDAQGTRWWPVAWEGYEGWVSGFYLIEPGTEPQTGETPESTTTPVPTQAPDDAADGLAEGDWAVISTRDGNGVNLRSAPNAESGQSGFAPDNGLVEIIADAGNGWFQVRWDDQTGYIDGSLLTEAEPPQQAGRPQPTATATATAEATQPPAADGVFVEGDEVQVDSDSGVGVNMRAEAAIDSDRVGFLSNGAIVEVTAGPVDDDEGDAWYAVTDGDQSGWVRADLLADPEAVGEDDEEPSGDRSSGAVNDTTGFILPVESFRFTQDFGCSSLGFYSYDPAWGCSVHDGVDLAAPSGTPLVAVGSGEVVAAGWCDCGLGYYVEINHGDGLHTVYGHMASQPYVSVGQQVAQGDTIGPVGSTGLSTGPHVHFMVRQDGAAQDPKGYLPPLT